MSNASESPRRFDPYLMSILAADLKRMAGLWGAVGRMRKDECAEAIRKGLAAPGRVAAAVAKLKPTHRTALAFIKEAGGELTPDCLEAAMVAAGHAPPGIRGFSRRHYAWSQDLIHRGIALATDTYHTTSLDSYGSVECRIFSDDRLLEHARQPEIARLEIDATLPVEAGVYRPPGSVVLDILAVLQAIEKTDGVGFTQTDMPRVSDTKKLRRELRWTDAMKIDGLPIPNLTEAVVAALRAGGLLAPTPSGLRLTEPPERFAARPRGEQVRPLLYGFATARGWTEAGWCGKDWDYWHHGGFACMRHALLTALRALPSEPPGCFALDHFDKALFDRVGEHVSLAIHSPSPPYAHGASSDELQRKMEAWQRELRSEWRKRERPWIERALATWLYWLGVVELAMESGAIRGFRLTPLGMDVFHGAKAHQTARKRDRASTGAWIVQPDFGLMVYIDMASPAQLAFVERIAERQGDAQRHVARYALTRDSVYGALESGYDPDAILDALAKGAERDVPANVEAEIRGWAERRERIVLRRRATLLEFPDEAGRQTAMKAGIEGAEVGDRFLLVASGKRGARAPVRKIANDSVSKHDYAQPLPPCVDVSETGRLRLATPHPDLLIRGQLDSWAKRLGDDAWELSEDSVRAAVKQHRSADELVDFLDSRAMKSVSPLLQIALKAWAGASFKSQLAKVTVLRCPQPDAFHAIAGAKLYKDCFLGRLGSDTFLVNTTKLKALQQALRWAGIEIETEVSSHKT